MLEFARWKYTVVAVVTLLALVIAAPNFFGEDLAVQVTRKDRVAMDEAARLSVEEALKVKGITLKRSFIDDGSTMLLFDEVSQQLAARDVMNSKPLSDTYDSSLARAPRAPKIFRTLGLRPMPLGLDLRGGLYLLYEVDVNGAINQLVDAYDQDFRRELTRAKIDFTDTSRLSGDEGELNGLRVTFPAGTDLDAAVEAMRRIVPDANYTTVGGDTPRVDATLTAPQITERKRGAIEQNMVTLRNRVGELGVTEPIVQQQGED